MPAAVVLEALPKEVTGRCSGSAAIGGGVGASYAIEGAGGLAKLGAAGVGVGAAAFAGLYASWVAGFEVGSYLYEHSETVRDFSQQVVGESLRVLPTTCRTEAAAVAASFNKPHLMFGKQALFPAMRAVRFAVLVPVQTHFPHFWRTV